MNTALLAFLVLMLFMVHEFEEIIFVRSWIANKSGKPKYKHELWARHAKHYPSTEALAAMIAEEFVLVGGILLLAVLLRMPELALAVLMAHALHLFGHLSQAFNYRAWVPGSMTAAWTLPLLISILAAGVAVNDISASLLVAMTVAVGILLLANLQALHNLAPDIEAALKKFTERHF